MSRRAARRACGAGAPTWTMDLGRGTPRPGAARDALGSPCAPERVRQGMTGPVRRDGRRVLDDSLVGAWEGLSTGRAVPCPLCDGPMRPPLGGQGTGAGPAVASCGRCGTELT